MYYRPCLLNSRNTSVFWEFERNMDFVHTFLKRNHVIEGSNDKELIKWIDSFDTDKKETTLDFRYEMNKGIQESLREF